MVKRVLNVVFSERVASVVRVEATFQIPRSSYFYPRWEGRIGDYVKVT